MSKSLLNLLFLILIAGCASPQPAAIFKPSTHQFSRDEIQRIEAIDPSAARIIAGGENWVQVENKTALTLLLANVQDEKAGDAWKSNLMVELSDKARRVVHLDSAYRDVAYAYCMQRQRAVTWGAVISPYQKRFFCRTAEEWLDDELNVLKKLCSVVDRDYADRFLFPRFSSAHSPKPLREPYRLDYLPKGFVEFYRQYMPIERCDAIEPALSALRNSKFVLEPKARGIDAGVGLSLEQVKKKCVELGFVEESEKFGDCILRLTK